MRRLLIIISIALLPRISHAQEIFDGKEYNEPTPAVWSLHTNGLYLLGGIFNVGAEMQLDCGLGVKMDYMGAWWNRRSTDHFYSCYGIQTELRYYLDAIKNYAPYRGHHFSIYGQLMTYDFEFGGTGYQSARFGRTWGTGISYGYTFPLKKHLSLDLNAGIGYFHTGYDIYQPYNGDYYLTGKGKRNFFGPTSLEVSLIWIINAKNY